MWTSVSRTNPNVLRNRVVPTYGAWCNTTGGLVARSRYGASHRRIVGRCRRLVQAPVDAVCLSLHGAMAGETEIDPEGRVASGIRQIVGDVPIVAAHGPARSPSRNGWLMQPMPWSFSTPIHTRICATPASARLACCCANWTGTSSPPRPVYPFHYWLAATNSSPPVVASAKPSAAAKKLRRLQAVWPRASSSATPLPTCPICSPMQSSPPTTIQLAPKSWLWKLARFMWENRPHWIPKLTPLEQAVRQAEETEGLTVFSDAADSTASGASGDSNAILKGLAPIQLQQARAHSHSGCSCGGSRLSDWSRGAVHLALGRHPRFRALCTGGIASVRQKPVRRGLHY